MFPGRNSRLDSINAAILNIKLVNFKKTIFKRNVLAKIYFNELKNINEIKLFKLDKINAHSFHQFVIRTEYRDQLREFLTKKGVETMVHYPYMLNEIKFFKNYKILNKSNNLGKKILSLPISEEHTKREIIYVSQLIKEYFGKFKFLN